MATRGSRVQIAEAVADEFRSRYPDMPDHLARGLGATYASVVDTYNTRAINAVRLANDTRESLATATPSVRDVDRTRAEAQTAPNAVSRKCFGASSRMSGRGIVLPFETDADRQAFRGRSRACSMTATRSAHIRRRGCARQGARGPARPALCRQGLSAVRCRHGQYRCPAPGGR